MKSNGKKVVLIFLIIITIFIIIFDGCIGGSKTKIKYVCSDGSVVSDARNCHNEETVEPIIKYVCSDSGEVKENIEDCVVSITTTIADSTTTTTTVFDNENATAITTSIIEEKTTTATVVTTTTKKPKQTTTTTTTTTVEETTTTTKPTTTTTTTLPEPTTTTTLPPPSQTQDIEISRTQFDAPGGDDRQNLNGEWVEIKNNGVKNLDVDMGGWTLKDEQEHTYTFPSGFVLNKGNSVKVHTGSGADTLSDLYWGSGRAIWNNGGDTATLKDSNGKIIDERSG